MPVITVNYLKFELSNSVDGRPIPILATSGTGTLIHTATAAAFTDGSEYDEVWIWAGNFDATPRVLGLQMGGTATSDIVHTTIPAQGGGAVLICPGITFQNGVAIRATAAIASAINCFGFVNRMARG